MKNIDITTDMIAGQRGFTLIEVLIALFVLTIGILGMMVMQTTAINSNARASSMTIASNIATDRIEEFRNMPFGGINAGTFTENDPASGFPVERIIAPGIANTMRITVTVTRPQGMAPVIFNYTKFRDL